MCKKQQMHKINMYGFNLLNPYVIVICTLITLSFSINAYAEKQLQLQLIKLPPGFKISLYAQNLPKARSLTLGDNGTVFVGSRNHDKVYALVDRDGDNIVDKTYIIAKRLWTPNGVAFYKGDLYVAEINRVLKYVDIENHLGNPPKPIVVNDSFPRNAGHGWKFIRFGPDDKLYVPVGAPCNACERGDQRFASIMRMDSDGSNLEIFAKGVRNSVGFDWHPKTRELWFTDNGRDNLGDDLPPDELNHATKKGQHFGFPYCHGGDLKDPKFGDIKPCSEFRAPKQKLGAHVASLGMRFYKGSMFPEKYRNQIFIAEHGSWNRSSKVGYRISLVTLENDQAVSYESFAEGWLHKGSKVWGRPVDVLVMPDGALLVSDDYAGAVYRISYQQ